MTDPRLTPANGRVAASELKGQVRADTYVDGEIRRVAASRLTLSDRAGGARQRELVYGDPVRVLETRDSASFLQSVKDGYVGWVDAGALGDPVDPTHGVAVVASVALSEPRVQAPEAEVLPFGARVRVVGGDSAGKFYETSEGWFLPRGHLRPLNRPVADPTTVAQLFFGAPYLWGGNTVWGIDCSGLIQAALLAAGIDCPGDSDMQSGLGAAAALPYRRGDLLFWKGHVAMAVDDAVMIHANAHSMSVSYEPIAEAVERIAAQGDGPVTTHRRL